MGIKTTVSFGFKLSEFVTETLYLIPYPVRDLFNRLKINKIFIHNKFVSIKFQYYMKL